MGPEKGGEFTMMDIQYEDSGILRKGTDEEPFKLEINLMNHQKGKK